MSTDSAMDLKEYAGRAVTAAERCHCGGAPSCEKCMRTAVRMQARRVEKLVRQQRRATKATSRSKLVFKDAVPAGESNW